MSIGSINSLYSFQKPFGSNVYSGANVGASKSVSIFGQSSNGNNQNASKVDFNSSIFNTKIDFKETAGLNPFSSVNAATKSVSGVSPVHAKENYMNGLAPSDNLQGVYAGQLNGKANILNQIAIA